MRLPPLSQHQSNDSHKAQQQDGSAGAQLDRLLAEGKLLDAALYAAKQQQHCHAAPAAPDKAAAGARVVVTVHADSSTAEDLGAAADGNLLQEQQQEAQQGDVWQSKCSKLQAWAGKALQQALPDLSLAELHKQLLRQAANSSSSSSSSSPDRPPMAWWRLPQLSSDAECNCQLATVVLQLGSSRTQGWARLAQALLHGLASPTALAAAAAAESASLRQHRRASRVQAQHHWLPHSAPKRLSELQAQQAARVKEVLASMPCSATLCVDLSEAGQLLLPRTYLQLVGQKVLARASATLPVLLSLPAPPPDWLLQGLFTDPFAQALQLALSEVLSNPDGDASPFIAMLQQRTPQLGDFRRVYPSCDTAAGAGPADSGGSITGATGRQQSGLLGDEQTRGFLWQVGNRALLGVLASIFRDVQEFEAGLLLAAVECGGPCKCRLVMLLTQDLQWVLEGCRQQLQELLSRTTEQLFVNTLEEELVQQPLNDLLHSAADVTPDTWPALAAAAAAACQQQATAGCISSKPAAVSCHNLIVAQSTGIDNKPSVDTSSSSSSSTQLSIFGSNSLMTYDDSTGTWELATEPARSRRNTSGRWHSSSVRGSLTGSSSFHGGSYGSRRSATGSKCAAALDAAAFTTVPAGPGASSLRSNSDTGGAVHSSPTGAVAAAGAAGAAGLGVADALLSQPQQVTQGQQQVLLFAGLFLARRQQFPLLVQDVLAGSIVQALLAAMEQMESLFGDPGSSSSTLASSSGEDTTAHCCCCISTLLCIQRRLLWLQQEWEPQGGSQHQQQQQELQQQPAFQQLALLNLAVEKVVALLESLQQHLVQQMQDTLRWAVVEAAAAQPWHSHRPPLRRPGSHKQQQQQQRHVPGRQQQADNGSGVLASPAVRLWHVLLQAWLYVVRRVLPARMAADILSQVLLQSTRSLVQLHCSLHPSAAWLPVLQQDIAVIAATAWEFCQPLQAVAQPQLQQHRQQLGIGGSSSGMLQHCSSSAQLPGKLRTWQGQQHQQQQVGQCGLVGRCHSITEECSAVQQSGAAASLPERMVCEVSALCKQLVLHSASLSSSSNGSADAQAAGNTPEQLQQEPAVPLRPASGNSCAEAAAVGTHDSSWGWLGAELQLVLGSRVLGQSLPARRLIDVTEHSAISTDMDTVEPDAWLQQGRQLLPAKATVGEV